MALPLRMTKKVHRGRRLTEMDQRNPMNMGCMSF